MDLGITDFDDSYPKRRPWLIILVVLVLVGVIFAVIKKRQGEQGQRTVRDASVVGSGDVLSGDGGEESDADKAGVAGIEKPATADLPVTPGSEAGLFEKGKQHESDGYFLSARKAYMRVLKGEPSGKMRAACESRLGRVNTKLVMSDALMPEKEVYVVRSGDALARIARKFGTTDLLVQASNGISDPRRIKPGQELSVLTGRFSILISKARTELVLKLNGGFFKRYRIGIGRDNRTPVGKFVIVNKLVEPKWFRRDGDPVPFGEKENILGTRWMSIKNAEAPEKDNRGFGIHGTWDNDSIGKAVSRGCIRMRNEEVEELYVLIPEGVIAEIVE